MTTAPGDPIVISSGGLELEGRLRGGDGDLAALVLHPHPRYGGDMDNHVVIAICDALAGLGATTLRFNFRGSGESEGSYDGGQGEAADALVAASSLRQAAPRSRLLLCGYSFGAGVAAAIAENVAPAALVLVSPPVGVSAFPALDAHLPTLLATGSRDAVAPAEGIRSLARDAISTVVIDGADHGWWPGVDQLVDEVARFVHLLT